MSSQNNLRLNKDAVNYDISPNNSIDSSDNSNLHLLNKPVKNLKDDSKKDKKKQKSKSKQTNSLLEIMAKTQNYEEQDARHLNSDQKNTKIIQAIVSEFDREMIARICDIQKLNHNTNTNDDTNANSVERYGLNKLPIRLLELKINITISKPKKPDSEIFTNLKEIAQASIPCLIHKFSTASLMLTPQTYEYTRPKCLFGLIDYDAGNRYNFTSFNIPLNLTFIQQKIKSGIWSRKTEQVDQEVVASMKIEISKSYQSTIYTRQKTGYLVSSYILHYPSNIVIFDVSKDLDNNQLGIKSLETESRIMSAIKTTLTFNHKSNNEMMINLFKHQPEFAENILEVAKDQTFCINGMLSMALKKHGFNFCGFYIYTKIPIKIEVDAVILNNIVKKINTAIDRKEECKNKKDKTFNKADAAIKKRYAKTNQECEEISKKADAISKKDATKKKKDKAKSSSGDESLRLEKQCKDEDSYDLKSLYEILLEQKYIQNSTIVRIRQDNNKQVKLNSNEDTDAIGIVINEFLCEIIFKTLRSKNTTDTTLSQADITYACLTFNEYNPKNTSSLKNKTSDKEDATILIKLPSENKFIGVISILNGSELIPEPKNINHIVLTDYIKEFESHEDISNATALYAEVDRSNKTNKTNEIYAEVDTSSKIKKIPKRHYSDATAQSDDENKYDDEKSELDIVNQNHSNDIYANGINLHNNIDESENETPNENLNSFNTQDQDIEKVSDPIENPIYGIAEDLILEQKDISDIKTIAKADIKEKVETKEEKNSVIEISDRDSTEDAIYGNMQSLMAEQNLNRQDKDNIKTTQTSTTVKRTASIINLKSDGATSINTKELKALEQIKDAKSTNKGKIAKSELSSQRAQKAIQIEKKVQDDAKTEKTGSVIKAMQAKMGLQ